MIAVMGSFAFPSASIDEPLDCYLHGYVSSRIMNLARTSSSSKSESESEPWSGSEQRGLAVCVAATKVDGLVLSLTPNTHSYNYRSAILHGYAQLVESVEEKLYAMELITNSVVPERWANSRTPPDGAEMQSTVILRVSVVDASAKIRDGAPHDEGKDTSRQELGERIWRGVVPVHEVLGSPVPSRENRVAVVPDHIRNYVEEVNGRNERYARDAAVDPS